MLQHTKNWWERKGSPASRVIFYIYTVVLFVATLIPLEAIQSDGKSWFSFLAFRNSDKIIHFLMFFVLTGLLFISYQFLKKIFYIAIPVTTGIVIEILQHTMGGGRTFDVWDITANTLGTLAAFFFIVKNAQTRANTPS